LSVEESSSTIGPGTYIDISNPRYSSMSKNLLKYSVDREIRMAHGADSLPFGSASKRFEQNYFRSKEGPGPADYETYNNSNVMSKK